FLFKHPALSGTRAVLLVSAATIPTAWLGIRCWHERFTRVAIAYLLAFCLLLPTTLLVAFGEWRLLTGLTRGDPALEFFSKFDLSSGSSLQEFTGTTNAQVWWALLLSLPAFVGLRRFTQASVFSLVVAVALALFCFTTLLRWGLLEMLTSQPDWF